MAEAAAGPSQDEEARQASVHELQNVKDTLSQTETRNKELEGQLENINKVKSHSQLYLFLNLFFFFWTVRFCFSCISRSVWWNLDSMTRFPQVVTEREAEARSAQEQSTRLQTDLTRLRQELQDKASQEDTLKQQMAEKEEKTRKALLNAKQKISHLTSERVFFYSKLVHPQQLFNRPNLFPCKNLNKLEIYISSENAVNA